MTGSIAYRISRLEGLCLNVREHVRGGLYLNSNIDGDAQQDEL